MIRARRLFLVPVLASFLCLTIWGIPLFLIIVIIWASRNYNNLQLYIRGINYEQGEYSKETIKEFN